MLATGIKSPVGVKVAGTSLAEIDRVTAQIERVVKDVPGVSSALAERLTGGRYIDVKIDRDSLLRGKMLYENNCRVCHGATGEGTGITTQYGMNAPPSGCAEPGCRRGSSTRRRATAG